MAQPRALAAGTSDANPSREGAMSEVTMRDAAVGEGPPWGAARWVGAGGKPVKPVGWSGGDYVASPEADLRQPKALRWLRNITAAAT